MMKLLGHLLASGYSDQTKQAGAEELDGWGRDCGNNKKCML